MMVWYHRHLSHYVIGVLGYWPCTPKRKPEEISTSHRRQFYLALSDSIFTESILVVKTCVNWKGEVISTEFQENQSTTSDTTLINKAIRAAKVYKFEERQGSPIQCGNMTFKFKLKNK
jgi:hypothetical protein